MKNLNKLLLEPSMLFIMNGITGQDDDFSYWKTMRILDKEGADLKSAPDMNSTSLNQIPFWSEILTTDFCSIKFEYDTIDDLPGIWKKNQVFGYRWIPV